MNIFHNVLGSLLLLALLRESVSCESNNTRNQGSTYISSSARYSLGGDLRVPLPSHAQEGDLLALFMSRTDDPLPLELDGWTTGPSCFKQDNPQRTCWTAEDCLESTISSSGIRYCTRFPQNHTGEDLATIMFHKPMNNHDHDILEWDLPGYHPAWATIAAISGANTTNPIRSSAVTSCDRKAAGVFPNVYGKKGYLLLLSMAHDDPADPRDFAAPLGTQLIQSQHGPDEAGFLFAKRLNVSKHTGTHSTRGQGTVWWCKDALISVVIRMQTSMLPSEDEELDNELVILADTEPCGAAITFADVLSTLMNFVRWKWSIFGSV